MNHIRELRERKMAEDDASRWTQKALAERLGAHEVTVANWEAGRGRPRRFYQLRLARLLGVTVQELGLDDREGIEGAEDATEPPAPTEEPSE